MYHQVHRDDEAGDRPSARVLNLSWCGVRTGTVTVDLRQGTLDASRKVRERLSVGSAKGRAAQQAGNLFSKFLEAYQRPSERNTNARSP